MIKYIENHMDKIIGVTIVLVIFGWLLSFNPWGTFERLKMICNFNKMILVSIWQNKVFNIFFVDSYGKFSWIGITSIIAIISLTFNAWDRRRQFNADLKSKSRIKWIENVRMAYSELVDTLMVTDGEQRGKHVTKNVTLLNLYFGDDELSENHLRQIFKNDELRDIRKGLSDFYIMIDKNEITDDMTSEKECWRIVKKILDSNDNEGKNKILKRCFIDLGRQTEGDNGTKSERDSLINKIDPVTEWLSLYLHLEWERAKQGD